jgi:hypothetical protein
MVVMGWMRLNGSCGIYDESCSRIKSLVTFESLLFGVAAAVVDFCFCLLADNASSEHLWYDQLESANSVIKPENLGNRRAVGTNLFQG